MITQKIKFTIAGNYKYKETDNVISLNEDKIIQFCSVQCAVCSVQCAVCSVHRSIHFKIEFLGTGKYKPIIFTLTISNTHED